jgi:hypothetical protein
MEVLLATFVMLGVRIDEAFEPARLDGLVSPIFFFVVLLIDRSSAVSAVESIAQQRRAVRGDTVISQRWHHILTFSGFLLSRFFAAFLPSAAIPRFFC